MLCPMCGAPVGEVVSLCANCQKLAQTQPQPTEKKSGQKSQSVESAAERRQPSRDRSDPMERPTLGSRPEVHAAEEIEEETISPTDLASPFSRVVAFFFDVSILAAFVQLVFYPLFARGVAEIARNFVLKKGGALKLHELSSSFQFSPQELVYQTVVFLLFFAVFLPVAWLYSSILEAKLSGTLGKLLVGIRVETPSGEPISFIRATFRFIAKFGWIVPIAFIFTIISGVQLDSLRTGSATLTVFRVLLALGYFITPLLAFFWFLLTIFTPAKQAAHDLLMDTVVRKRGVSIARSLICLGITLPIAGYLISGWLAGIKVPVVLTAEPGAPANSADAITSRHELDAYLKRKEEERQKEAALVATSKPLTEEVQTEIEKKVAELPDDIFGFAISGAERIRYRSVLAAYSPKTQNVIVALYSKAFTANERVAAVKELLGTTQVTRTPSAIVGLELRDPKLDITSSNVARYSVRFYREFGVFSFPGIENSVVFQRQNEEFTKREVRSLSGTLERSARIQAVLVGKSRSESGIDFEWGLKFNAPIEQP